MDLLEVKDLSVVFMSAEGGHDAVKGVSFNIMQDETVCLVGESGSGKTVTALSIMGIQPKDARIMSGSIVFSGKNLAAMPHSQLRDIRGKEMSMIFQEPFTCLNPVITVGVQVEEMLLAHSVAGKKEAKEKAVQLLRKVMIKEPESRYFDYPHQLSGGERQRVMIAMAIALKPKLLIADEPTTALDVTIQAEILKLLKSIKAEMGMSMLFITHDFGIVNEIADRVVVLKDGEAVEQGEKGRIFKQPAHPYTKRLIEAVPRMDTKIEIAPFYDKDIMVSVRSVTKSFSIERGFLKSETGRLYAVKDVSIDIPRGITAGLLGESGSGKSTLGRLILGLDRPDKGEVLINGQSCAEKYPLKVRKMMQIVFQDPYSSLDPRMKMGEIVLEGAALLGVSKQSRDAILKCVLEQVQLPYDDRDKYPHQFSGGQRQRIAIARAIAVKPDFLVLDEPVSSLDVIIQKDILALLSGLKKQSGLTYLFISHDLRVIRSLADKIFVMHSGRIVEEGGVRDIYEHPKQEYTRRLVQSVPGIIS